MLNVKPSEKQGGGRGGAPPPPPARVWCFFKSWLWVCKRARLMFVLFSVTNHSWHNQRMASQWLKAVCVCVYVTFIFSIKIYLISPRLLYCRNHVVDGLHRSNVGSPTELDTDRRSVLSPRRFCRWPLSARTVHPVTAAPAFTFGRHHICSDILVSKDEKIHQTNTFHSPSS